MPDKSVEELEQLEQRIEGLLEWCAQLREENRALRESLEQLNAERARLQEKHEAAQSQIEAMIGRLKAMEQ